MLITKKRNTLVKIVLFVLLIATGNIAFAYGENPYLKTSKEIEKSLVISFDYKTEKDIQITFRDAKAITLFKESVQGVKHLSKTFDLRSLPDGTYFLEIEDEIKIFSQCLEIKNEKVLYNKAGEQSLIKPTTYIKGDKLYLSCMLQNETDVEIVIYDKSGEKVYIENLEKQISLEKTFQFVDGRPSDYAISIRYNDRKFDL